VKVYAVFELVSDQYGTERLVGVFASEVLAQQHKSKNRLCSVREIDVQGASDEKERDSRVIVQS
jgi:hypothetical protein